MLKFLSAAGAALALSVVAAQPAAAAVTFDGNYAITDLNSTGANGLQVSVSPNPGTLNFTMNDAPSILNNVQLFKIWTTEGSLNADDYNGSTITVNFNFTAPGAGAGQIGGVTQGESSFFGFFQNGVVTWQGDSVIDFGQYGKLNIHLDDAVFNEGSWWSLNDGKRYGDFITADFTLTPGPIGSAVPEPATWAMMITGFGLAGAAIRRRRNTLAIA